MTVDWSKFFEILTKSSPASLFKFKFYMSAEIESFKTFFDNWKDKQPMLLQTISNILSANADYLDLMEKYKTKGIIKKYKLYNIRELVYDNDFKDFNI
ncbi:hypothetical protein C1645_824987 [Glomus cerebriforme]|uniref:Uncharacterized protein n=1 Tax=Glomus cerebriforme TaxID=658196 RepID=A0A397SZX0_9GLOM|nr:hypothetical protein C1645_824987 [Glomus cerebriforme]